MLQRTVLKSSGQAGTLQDIKIIHYTKVFYFIILFFEALTAHSRQASINVQAQYNSSIPNRNSPLILFSIRYT